MSKEIMKPSEYPRRAAEIKNQHPFTQDHSKNFIRSIFYSSQWLKNNPKATNTCVLILRIWYYYLEN
jgi:hypothetical protein